MGSFVGQFIPLDTLWPIKSHVGTKQDAEEQTRSEIPPTTGRGIKPTKQGRGQRKKKRAGPGENNIDNTMHNIQNIYHE